MVKRRCPTARGLNFSPFYLLSDKYDAVVAAGCFLPGHMTEESFPELIRLTKPSKYLNMNSLMVLSCSRTFTEDY